VPPTGGGVTPPIGTLPPKGITPTVPPTTTPLTPTVPPTSGGVTPVPPTLPPTGGGVTPPTVVTPTLPPTGPGVVPPVEPGRPLPPTGPVPPLTPERPTVVARVDRNLELPVMVASVPVRPCPDPDFPERDMLRPEDCPDPQLRETDDVSAQPGGQRGIPVQAPLTEGRQFLDDPAWNVWFAVGPFTDTADQRHGLDNSTRSNYATFGIDRKLGADVVFGVSANLESNQTEGFGSTYRVTGEGITAGPHLAYRLSDEWTMDLSATTAWYNNQTHVDMMSGSYASRRYTGSLNFSGQYVINNTSFRPRLSGSFTYSSTDPYDLDGSFYGNQMALPFDAAVTRYGDTTTGLEINHAIGRFIPYLDLSVRYEYLRANDGMIMSGDLTAMPTSAWTGMVKFGARTLLGGMTFLEIGGGYTSFFQRQLNTWESRIFLSQGF
jgi:hypothetical protein